MPPLKIPGFMRLSAVFARPAMRQVISEWSAVHAHSMRLDRPNVRSLQTCLELLEECRRGESTSRVALARERRLERADGGAEIAKRGAQHALLAPELRAIGCHRQHAFD